MNIKYFSTNGYDFYPAIEVSETEYIGLPVCQPEMEPDVVGVVTLSVEGGSLDTPSISTDEIGVGAPVLRVFSEPQNL